MRVRPVCHEHWFVSNFDYALEILPACAKPSGPFSLALVCFLSSVSEFLTM